MSRRKVVVSAEVDDWRVNGDEIESDEDGDVFVYFRYHGGSGLTETDLYVNGGDVTLVPNPELTAGQVWADDNGNYYLVTQDRYGEVGFRDSSDRFIDANEIDTNEYRLVEENA